MTVWNSFIESLLMMRNGGGPDRFRRQQVAVNLVSQLKWQLLEEVTGRARVTLVLVTKLKARRWRPSEKPPTPFSVGRLELTPPREAVLAPMGAAGGEIGGMSIHVRSFANNSAAA